MEIFYLFFLGIWVGLAIAVRQYAKGKGLDPGAFFIASLLLSPVIGWLAAAVASPRSSSAPSRKCPQCAESVLTEAVKCRFCGSALENLPPASEKPFDGNVAWQPGSRPSQGIPRWAIAFIIVFFSFVGAVLFFSYSDENARTAPAPVLADATPAPSSSSSSKLPTKKKQLPVRIVVIPEGKDGWVGATVTIDGRAKTELLWKGLRNRFEARESVTVQPTEACLLRVVYSNGTSENFDFDPAKSSPIKVNR